jgi:hypothetical protein
VQHERWFPEHEPARISGLVSARLLARPPFARASARD